MDLSQALMMQRQRQGQRPQSVVFKQQSGMQSPFGADALQEALLQAQQQPQQAARPATPMPMQSPVNAPSKGDLERAMLLSQQSKKAAQEALSPFAAVTNSIAGALADYKAGNIEDQIKQSEQAKQAKMAELLAGSGYNIPPELAEGIGAGDFINIAMNKEKMAQAQKQFDTEVEFKRQQIALEREKMTKEKEAPRGFQGTGMDAQIYNILLYGDPASPEYALAYSQAMQPKIVTIPDPNDPSRLIQAAIEPKLPSAIRKPLSGQTTAQPAAPQAADAMQMPAAAPQAAPPQTNDGFTVTPIGGTSRSKDLSKDERDAATFADRMKDAELTFAKSETPSTIERGVSNLPIVGNFLASPNTQSFQQAERNFVNATLRRESGATISPSEFSNARQQYVPQPGDSLEVLQQKQKNRQTVMQGLRNASGQSKILTYNPATGKLE